MRGALLLLSRTWPKPTATCFKAGIGEMPRFPTKAQLDREFAAGASVEIFCLF
jgi:hypothetical protein